jgi:hypothetical protein
LPIPVQDGKKKVRKPVSLVGNVGDTFVVYYFAMLDTCVKTSVATRRG